MTSNDTSFSYDRVAPQPPNEAYMTITTYPAAGNLSTNHRASGDTSLLRLWGRRRHYYRPLCRKTETRKGEIDTSAWYKESTIILHLHLLFLLRRHLQLWRQNIYLPLLLLQTKTTRTRRNTDTWRKMMEWPRYLYWRWRFSAAVTCLFRLSHIHLAPVVVVVPL